VPTYQYSLDYFKLLFVGAIQDAEQDEELENRLKNLDDTFLQSLYRNICRSLFEQHKLLFSALLAVKLMDLRGDIDMSLFMFMLTGGVDVGEELPPNPTAEQGLWISTKSWGEVNRLGKFKAFKGVADKISNNVDHYKKWYDSSLPADYNLGEDWAHLNPFEFMCFLRCIRQDMLIQAIAKFVHWSIGEYFVEPPMSDLPTVFKDSQAAYPLIFVLSPGADPLNALENFALSKKKDIDKVSLGQGQGPKAEKFIEDGIKSGNWVCL